jgi:hypothetical protein
MNNITLLAIDKIYVFITIIASDSKFIRNVKKIMIIFNFSIAISIYLK